MVDLAMKNNMMKNDCSLLGCATALLVCSAIIMLLHLKGSRSIKNAKIHHVARTYGKVRPVSSWKIKMASQQGGASGSVVGGCV